ncbi:MAG TPA: PP2C family serine/threonine-protein phosphatase [Ktedonobacteraceae bacterium]
MERIAGIHSKAWKIIGASVAGTSHIKQHSDCEDARAYKQLANGSLMLIVADGAGSARYSAKGSQVAVDAALESLEQKLYHQSESTNEDEWEKALEQVIRVVRTKLEELPINLQEEYLTIAQSQSGDTEDKPQDIQDVSLTKIHDKSAELEETDHEETFQSSEAMIEVPSLHDFATTLLVAAVTPKWIVVAQVGDGAIIVQNEKWTFELLTQPNHGEYVNQTSFITDADFLQQVQYNIKPRLSTLEGMALITDGLENLALDFATKTPYQPFFAPLFRFAACQESTEEELKNFLSSVRVCKQTDDDKTLVLAVLI